MKYFLLFIILSVFIYACFSPDNKLGNSITKNNTYGIIPIPFEAKEGFDTTDSYYYSNYLFGLRGFNVNDSFLLKSLIITMKGLVVDFALKKNSKNINVHCSFIKDNEYLYSNANFRGHRFMPGGSEPLLYEDALIDFSYKNGVIQIRYNYSEYIKKDSSLYLKFKFNGLVNE